MKVEDGAVYLSGIIYSDPPDLPAVELDRNEFKVDLIGTGTLAPTQ